MATPHSFREFPSTRVKRALDDCQKCNRQDYPTGRQTDRPNDRQVISQPTDRPTGRVTVRITCEPSQTYFISRDKNVLDLEDRGSEDFFVGDEAQKRREMMQLTRPIIRGVIEHWDEMEKLWDYVMVRPFLCVPTHRQQTRQDNWHTIL